VNLCSQIVETDICSTLGLMMTPSQYGMSHYGSPPSYPQNYPSSSQHGYAEHRLSTSGPYESSYASSSALEHEQRRPEDHSVLPPYQALPQSLSRNTYHHQHQHQHQQPSNPMRSNSTPLAPTAQGYGYPASQSSISNQPLGSNASSYPPYVILCALC
jgi:hypothetical protein